MLSDLHASRALAGIARDVGRRGPSADQWVEALAIVCTMAPLDGSYRKLVWSPSGVIRIEPRPLPPDQD